MNMRRIDILRTLLASVVSKKNRPVSLPIQRSDPENVYQTDFHQKSKARKHSVKIVLLQMFLYVNMIFKFASGPLCRKRFSGAGALQGSVN